MGGSLGFPSPKRTIFVSPPYVRQEDEVLLFVISVCLVPVSLLLSLLAPFPFHCSFPLPSLIPVISPFFFPLVFPGTLVDLGQVTDPLPHRVKPPRCIGSFLDPLLPGSVSVLSDRHFLLHLLP